MDSHTKPLSSNANGGQRPFLRKATKIGAVPVFVLTVLFATGRAEALVSDSAQFISKQSNLPEYVPGEVIVKLREPAGRGEAPFDQKYSDRIRKHEAAISHLETKYPVKKDKPVFRKLHAQLKAANKSERTLLDTHQRKIKASRPARRMTEDKSPSFLPIYQFTTKEDVLKTVEALKRDPDVEDAAPNYLARIFVASDDSLYSDQWSHQRTSAELAWGIHQGNTDTVIAVIDTGVDHAHEDLKPNIWTNHGEDLNANGIFEPGDCSSNPPAPIEDLDCDGEFDTEDANHDGILDDSDVNGVDDDENGYVDDIRGWDFVDLFTDPGVSGEDYMVEDNDPSDFQGHGTHVAGIAAGKGNNGIGIAGACWNCSIMALRAGYAVPGDGLLEDSDIAQAIAYAADHGADVINMSFGGRYPNFLQQTAVAYADSLGVILVASAGNDNISQKSYPAAYDSVISVAATTISDAKAGYSNYGNWVSVSAPGSWILSTVPRTGVNGNPAGYGYFSGTSMAAPYVAGAAGLLKSFHPEWTNEELWIHLLYTADSIDAVNPNYVGLLGSGRINLYAAFTGTPRPSLRVRRYEIENDSGNQDQIPNPGETMDLILTLVNKSFDAQTVHAVLESDDPRMTILKNESDFPPIANRATGKNTMDPFQIEVSSEVPFDTPISFSLRITTNGAELSAPVLFKLLVPFPFAPVKHQAGWPVEIPAPSSFPLMEGAITSPVLKDLESDGRFDVVVMYHLNSSPEATLDAFENDGTRKAGFPIRIPAQKDAPVSVADLDLNGYSELVTHTFSSETGLENEIRIYAYDVSEARYALHRQITFPDSWGRSWNHAVLGDIAGDERLEIIVSALEREGTGFPLVLKPVIYAWDHDGNLISGWPVHVNVSGRDQIAAPALGDLNQDGKKEIILAYEGKIYAWEGNGKILHVDDLVDPWPVAIETGSILEYTSPQTGDMDGDGNVDVIQVRSGGGIVIVYTDSTGRVREVDDFPLEEIPPQRLAASRASSTTQNYDPINRSVTTLALADIDGDGDLEMFIFAGKLYALHHDGTPLVGEWPIPFGDDSIFMMTSSNYQSVTLGDADGDGDSDVMLLVYFQRDYHAGEPNQRIMVYAFDQTGAMLPGWPYSSFESDGSDPNAFLDSYSAPVLGDLDRDGDLEVLFSYNLLNSWTYDTILKIDAIDLSAPYRAALIQWPTFQRDNAHTGSYPPTQLESAVSIKSHSAAGEFPLNLSLAFSSTVSEPRTGDDLKIKLDFNRDLLAGSVRISTTANGLALQNTYEVGLREATVVIPETLDQSCVKIQVLDNQNDPIAGDSTVHLKKLLGDVTGDGTVNIVDLSAIKTHLFRPVTASNFIYDVNRDGAINIIDLSEVKLKLFSTISCSE